MMLQVIYTLVIFPTYSIFYHNVMISLSGSKEGETTHVVKLYNHRLPLTVRSLVIITPVIWTYFFLIYNKNHIQ